jgi:phosphoglycolate phosphatase-like HAD superfamily hydrolase
LALADGFGINDDLKDIEIAGRTDSGIARRIFEKHRIAETAENLTAFFDGYLHHLELLLPQTGGRLCPGILPLLETLKARADIVLALLTGNLMRGAELKLTHYGVWRYFDFGAFADDHSDRNQLGHFARERARERRGVEIPPKHIYVLGDTPHDIACARVIGANAVAIATGSFTREQLAKCGPDFLYDDLSDPDAILAAIA